MRSTKPASENHHLLAGFVLLNRLWSVTNTSHTLPDIVCILIYRTLIMVPLAHRSRFRKNNPFQVSEKTILFLSYPHCGRKLITESTL